MERKKEVKAWAWDNETAFIQYQKEMMKCLSCLLPYSWTSDKHLIYEKGNGLPLTKWGKEEPSAQEILNMIEALLAVMSETEQYLLDIEKWHWEPDWVFWDSKRKTLQLVYLPWVEEACENDLLWQFIRWLWRYSVEKEWSGEKQIMLLHRLQIAEKKIYALEKAKQPDAWGDWLQKEKQNMAEEKENALDVLTFSEENGDLSIRGKWRLWWKNWREWFPFALR